MLNPKYMKVKSFKGMSAMVDDDTVDTVIQLKCSGAVFFVLKVQFLDVQRQQSFLNPNSFISNLLY
jgi:hypothetical protein